MISGGAEGMAVCDPCVRIREKVFGIPLKVNGVKSGAKRSCWLVFRGGPQLGWCSVRYMYV
jgi:hypothetical protein